MATMHPIRSSLLLLLTALIWGLAFVAQRTGMAYIGPFLFVALRMILGAAILLVVLVCMHLKTKQKKNHRPAFSDDTSDIVNSNENNPSHAADNNLEGKRLMLAGIACGLVLFASSSFQQIGLVDIDAGKAGFLTALYIVLVPILGVVLRHKTHWNAWLSVAIAVLGLYFLCIKDGQDIQFGDLITLLGAFGWACHILVIDHFVEGITERAVLKLCVAQFCVAGLLALAAFPAFDALFVQLPLNAEALIDAAPAFLYVGILSTGVAFTLQAVGQQGLTPTAASLIMSLESVFAVIGGMLLLQESMDLREFAGCALMFAAVILSQLPIGQKRLQV